MTMSMQVTRYERSKRDARAWIAAGIIFAAQFVAVAIFFPEGVLAKAPPLIGFAVGVCLLVFPVIPIACFCFGLRRVAACVETSSEGIRNPARGEDWLPWDCIVEIRSRKLVLRYEVFGDADGAPVLIGLELKTSSVLTEALRNATTLRESATGRREFPCYSITCMLGALACGAIFAFLIVNADVLFYMKTFGPIIAAGGLIAILFTPKRMRIDEQSVLLSYPLWSTRIQFLDIEELVYFNRSIVFRNKAPRKTKQVPIRHDCQDAYFSCLEAWEAARGTGAVTA